MNTIIEEETDLGAWVSNEDETNGFWHISYYFDGDTHYRRFSAKNVKEALKTANDGGIDFILDGGKDSWTD
jgi:hypothetical protein